MVSIKMNFGMHRLSERAVIHLSVGPYTDLWSELKFFFLNFFLT